MRLAFIILLTVVALTEISGSEAKGNDEGDSGTDCKGGEGVGNFISKNVFIKLRKLHVYKIVLNDGKVIKLCRGGDGGEGGFIGGNGEGGDDNIPQMGAGEGGGEFIGNGEGSGDLTLGGGNDPDEFVGEGSGRSKLQNLPSYNHGGDSDDAPLEKFGGNDSGDSPTHRIGGDNSGGGKAIGIFNSHGGEESGG